MNEKSENNQEQLRSNQEAIFGMLEIISATMEQVGIAKWNISCLIDGM